jgi:DNA-binding transcriptional MerR regulator
MASLSIGELARGAGVATSTVRYYERSGLLKPDERSRGSNYRRYHPRSLEKLRFIRAAQGIGLSLREVAELLALTDRDADPCADVENVLRRRVVEIRRQLRDLRRVERTLARALGMCCKGGEPGICEAVVRLRRG